MEFNLSTPALFFSAISLFMLAHTNRFLALSTLIRQYIARYESHPEENVWRQILNFRKRLRVLKATQISGVFSFLACVISMFLIFVGLPFPAQTVFVASLLALFVSLVLSLQELFLSIGALDIEMQRIRKEP